MFRVLLKVDSVRLRVKEPVGLHILVRKDHHHFAHCRDEPLRHGQAHPSNTSEFLIDANDPKFELELYLTMGETRKRGGTVLINLRSFAINASHRVTAPIKKTPLADSTLLLDFAYMRWEAEREGEGLVSLSRVEEAQHRNHLREITAEHEKLVFHNHRLLEEVKQLKQKNIDLSNESRSLQQSITQREIEFSSEIQQMEEVRERSRMDLQNQRKKIEQIVEKITKSGDNSLMVEMDKVMGQLQSQSQSPISQQLETPAH